MSSLQQKTRWYQKWICLDMAQYILICLKEELTYIVYHLDSSFPLLRFTYRLFCIHQTLLSSVRCRNRRRRWRHVFELSCRHIQHRRRIVVHSLCSRQIHERYWQRRSVGLHLMLERQVSVGRRHRERARQLQRLRRLRRRQIRLEHGPHIVIVQRQLRRGHLQHRRRIGLHRLWLRFVVQRRWCKRLHYMRIRVLHVRR